MGETEQDGLADLDGTGRHLTREELRAWTGFLDAGRMLDEVLSRHLSREHSMSHREYEVLVRLDGANGRMRMSDLARQIVASAPLISQTIERLERRGLVRREAASDGDGRGVEAVLLDPGREALALASGPHADIIDELLIKRIREDRLASFADAVTDTADHLRAHRRGEPCDDENCAVTRFS